jgi:uncharacterized Rossmann fold enzyme
MTNQVIPAEAVEASYSYTDRDGDTFSASYIGEGMIRLRGVYGAKVSEACDIDFMASDINVMIAILQQASKDAK